MPKNKVKLGDLLLNAGIINNEQLNQALQAQREKGGKFGATLIELGLVTEKVLLDTLSKQLNIEYVDLTNFNVDVEIVRQIPEKIARRFRVVALDMKNNKYLVGMVDPTDILAFDEITKILGNSIQIVLVKESGLLNIVDHVYRRTEDIVSFAKELKEELGKEKPTFRSSEENVSGDESSPVAKLLDSIFEDAVQVGASDIHIEPETNLVRIRQRVDGILQESIIEGRQIADSLILRIKLLAKLNISEKRLPQDGRFLIKVKGKSLDIRAATMPVRYGETAVLRLLDQSAGILQINQLGIREDILHKILFHIHRPNGLILVTGPTGSGKTTTLYSILNELNVQEKKIITIEDPIEYSLSRISQIQVNSTIGLTFARILRTALRQDPEIIMVGEMRDEETAQIGLRAAMTGHLVLATLHTNDAVSSATRLLDMGSQGYLVASSLRAIIAQRLVRKICQSCTKETDISSDEKEILKNLIGHIDPNWKFSKGTGCSHCSNTGYKGRIAVHELLEMNFELSNALRTGDSAVFNKTALQQKDFRPLAMNILDYALKKITSIEEMFRIAGEVSDIIKNTDTIDNNEPMNIKPQSEDNI
jgi:MSHA biogenesis protein MshE